MRALTIIRYLIIFCLGITFRLLGLGFGEALGIATMIHAYSLVVKYEH